MWIGEGLEDEEKPPEYLSNPKVREGVSAMLVLRRAKEEESRLQAEGTAMVTWVDMQLKKTQMALEACTGSILFAGFPVGMLLIYIMPIRCAIPSPAAAS